MCEPSRGGKGNKLKAKRNMLKNTPNHKTFFINSKPSGIKLSIKAKNKKNNTARTKFDIGPAAETKASSLSGSLKLFLFTGTGLAHPINANPDANAIIGIRTLPTRSICFNGFNVIRPRSLAVESPFLFAVYACANSWTANDTKNIGRKYKNEIRRSLT